MDLAAIQLCFLFNNKNFYMDVYKNFFIPNKCLSFKGRDLTLLERNLLENKNNQKYIFRVHSDFQKLIFDILSNTSCLAKWVDCCYLLREKKLKRLLSKILPIQSAKED